MTIKMAPNPISLVHKTRDQDRKRDGKDTHVQKKTCSTVKRSEASQSQDEGTQKEKKLAKR